MKRLTLLVATAALAVVLLVAAGNNAGTCVPVEPTDPVCVEVDPWQFGVCAMVLGVVYYDGQCQYASGCSCEPHCDQIFPDMESCRAACDLPTDGLPVGAICEADSECADGLLCCYPCGIEGCENRCTAPCTDEPWCSGGCPLYP